MGIQPLSCNGLTKRQSRIDSTNESIDDGSVLKCRYSCEHECEQCDAKEKYEHNHDDSIRYVDWWIVDCYGLTNCGMTRHVAALSETARDNNGKDRYTLH